MKENHRNDQDMQQRHAVDDDNRHLHIKQGTKGMSVATLSRAASFASRNQDKHSEKHYICIFITALAVKGAKAVMCTS